MKRRTFMQTVAAATIAPAIPTIASAETVNMAALQKVIDSFPVIDIPKDSAGEVMTFFMRNRVPPTVTDSSENHVSFSVEKSWVNPGESYNLQEVLPEGIEELTFEAERTNASKIISATSKVAQKSRRGRGNHYAVFDDHILVWYAGPSSVDSPVQRIGKNVGINPSSVNYFIKVKDVNLSDEDHELLANLLMKRVC